MQHCVRLHNGDSLGVPLTRIPTGLHYPKSLKYIELHPMDVLVCDKKYRPFPKDLFKHCFRWLVYLYHSIKYPWLPPRYRWATHIKLFVGQGILESPTPEKDITKTRSALWVFDFTSPRARFQEFEPWMADPNYARIVCSREIREAVYPQWRKFYMTFLALCEKYEGSGYNYGELLAMATGIKKFTFGRKQKVCSTGARMVLENTVGHAFDQEPDIYPRKLFGTPPAWFYAKAVRPPRYLELYKVLPSEFILMPFVTATVPPRKPKADNIVRPGP